MYWSSFMTSSMQLAKECLSQKLTDDMGESFQPFEGLEKFAETIETGKLLLCFLAFSRFTSQILCKAMSFKCLLSQFWEESKWRFWTVFLESNTFQKILKLESLLRFESTSKFLTVSGTFHNKMIYFKLVYMVKVLNTLSMGRYWCWCLVRSLYFNTWSPLTNTVSLQDCVLRWNRWGEFKCQCASANHVCT